MRLGIGLGVNRFGVPLPTRANTLVTGQSIANLMFSDGDFNDADAGKTAFEGELANYYPSYQLIDGAKNGIAIDDANAGAAGAYLDSDNVSKSSEYTTEITNSVSAAGLTGNDIDWVLLCIGNTDAAGMNDGTPTQATMETRIGALFDLYRADFPNAKLGVIPLGADTNSNDFTGFRNYKQAMYEYVRDTADVYEFPSYLNETYKDDTHLDETGATDFWPRVAKRMAALDGLRSTTGTIGPIPSSLDFDVGSDLIYVNLTFDGTTTYTTNEATAFQFDINGTLYNASFAVAEATRVRCRASGRAIQAGDNITVKTCLSNFKSKTPSNILTDNDGLPLRVVNDVSGQIPVQL